jgi:D-alanyl-D-alanine carboxypeptidase
MGWLRGPAGYSYTLAQFRARHALQTRTPGASPPPKEQRERRALRMFALIAIAAVMVNGNARAAVHASIVIDAQSGRVLESSNADTLAYPASLTKLMTLYLVFGALARRTLKLDQQLPVSAHAAAQAATRLGLHSGERITVEDAILAIVTKSANDAAVVLAEALGGSEDHFAGMMTAAASKLGMEQTVFRNASGLPDPRQHTTARDMATLARALILDYPQYYHFFSTRSFVFHGRLISGHDHLLGEYPGTDGLKTGYTRASGYNLVTSAVHKGRRLIGVVMGGATFRARDARMMALLDTGFAADFARAQLASAGLPNGEVTSSGALATSIVSSPSVKAVAAKEAAAIAGRSPDKGRLVSTVAKDDADSDETVAQAAAQPRDEGIVRPGGHRWRVEVGGRYRHVRHARRVRRSLVRSFPRQLNNSPPEIIHGGHGRSRFYRVEVADLTHAGAIRVCHAFARKRFTCKVAGPADHNGLLEASR